MTADGPRPLATTTAPGPRADPQDTVAARRLREAVPREHRDKVVSEAEAMALVPDGGHVAVGGTNYSRTPMSLLFGLMRSGRRDLTVSRPLCCYEAELLLAGGTATTLMTSWVGVGHGWGLARVLRELVEAGHVRYEEWSHLGLGMRYRAGAMGVPFLPTYTMLGSDLARDVGATEVACPYTGQRLLAARALHPDVALVHVHRADRYGNAQIDGYPFMDVDMVHAARRVILSTEEVVDPEELRRVPRQTVVPHFVVDAVVPAPMGAFPHECYGRYEADAEHFAEYMERVRAAGSQGAREYIASNVAAYRDFDGFLDSFEVDRIARRRARVEELMPR